MTARLFVICLFCLLISGCGSTNVEGPKAYRAWCNTEQRFLGPWMDTKEAAEALQAEHRKRQPWHAVNINIAAQADVKDRMQRSEPAADR